VCGGLKKGKWGKNQRRQVFFLQKEECGLPIGAGRDRPAQARGRHCGQQNQ